MAQRNQRNQNQGKKGKGKPGPPPRDLEADSKLAGQLVQLIEKTRLDKPFIGELKVWVGTPELFEALTTPPSLEAIFKVANSSTITFNLLRRSYDIKRIPVLNDAGAQKLMAAINSTILKEDWKPNKKGEEKPYTSLSRDLILTHADATSWTYQVDNDAEPNFCADDNILPEVVTSWKPLLEEDFVLEKLIGAVGRQQNRLPLRGLPDQELFWKLDGDNSHPTPSLAKIYDHDDPHKGLRPTTYFSPEAPARARELLIKLLAAKPPSTFGVSKIFQVTGDTFGHADTPNQPEEHKMWAIMGAPLHVGVFAPKFEPPCLYYCDAFMDWFQKIQIEVPLLDLTKPPMTHALLDQAELDNDFCFPDEVRHFLTTVGIGSELFDWRDPTSSVSYKDRHAALVRNLKFAIKHDPEFLLEDLTSIGAQDKKPLEKAQALYYNEKTLKMVPFARQIFFPSLEGEDRKKIWHRNPFFLWALKNCGLPAEVAFPIIDVIGFKAPRCHFLSIYRSRDVCPEDECIYDIRDIMAYGGNLAKYLCHKASLLPFEQVMPDTDYQPIKALFMWGGCVN